MENYEKKYLLSKYLFMRIEEIKNLSNEEVNFYVNEIKKELNK